MRKIILVGGDLASGKSTYSVFLAKKFNLSLINKDRLKEILGDTILVTNRTENKKLSVVSFNLIKYIIESTTEDLIIESNFKSYEMEELKQYLATNDILSLKFRGDNETLHKRFLFRLTQNRHYVHKSQDLSKLEDFVAIEEELRQVQYIGTIIDSDIGKGYASDVPGLTEKVASFLQR